MQLTNYYLQLRTAYVHAAEGEPQRVTLEELAAVLFCTTRNVKLLLKKMSELAWLVWEPGRGRGNASSMTFLVPAAELISRQAVELAQKGDFKSAMELINRYGDRYPLKESFVEWLFSYFGYKAEEKEERRLDSLRFPVFRPIQTLDPIHAFFSNDAHVIDHVFDTLVSFNTRTRSIEPRLAHYWEANEDRTEWTFYLRKHVLFHHGREMTAYDVKFTLQRLMSPAAQSTHIWLFSGVKDIVVLNRTTVRIELNGTNHLFLQHLAETCTSIVPEEICREHGGLFTRMPIGTGPFRIECHDEYLCRLRAFDGYYGERPYLDQVELWVLPEAMPSWRKNPVIVRSVCDAKGFFEPMDRLSQDPGWKQREDEVPGCTLLTFNLDAPGPQRHAKFREAVDLLIDRDGLVRELGGNRLGPAYSFLTYEDDTTVTKPYETNVEKAKALLDEIGYEGEPLRLYSYRKDPDDIGWIAERCALAGIKVETHTLSREEMQKPQRIAEADMIYYGVVLEGLAFTMLGIFLQRTSYVAAHMGRKLRRAVEADVRLLQTLADEGERKAMLRRIEERLKEERAFLFVLRNSHQTAFHESVKGVTVNAHGWVDFRKLFITRSDQQADEPLDPVHNDDENRVYSQPS
ncbi:ABC transporter substrate-binding protein [Paenibacillus chartarius]|uniref:ABC transporter substrate-binding protein n=1 Tax=Paenibacillus chartarius TaxID=747481 RepID=A0ABV6DRV0_9BACL